MSATAAPREVGTTEVREVAAFERIDLRDHVNLVDLVAEPGSRQVVVQGPPEMLARVRTRVEDGTLVITLAATLADHLRDAVTTSLTRRQLVYRVRAPQLLEVRVAGMVRVAVHAFGANAPVVTRLEPSPPAVPRPPR